MSDLSTIRERIQQASRDFKSLEAVLLTTFDLSVPFFEEQVLPIVLDVDAPTPASRRASVHQKLGETSLTVYFDPIFSPQINAEYRYLARPVPLTKKFFHPKIVVMAGKTRDDNTSVYLSVSSANLSLSGWGRNAESFGETWIKSRGHRSSEALAEFLRWLESQVTLGDESGREATSLIRQTLALMPDGPTDLESPRFYASVNHNEGFPEFLKQGEDILELVVFSPYWAADVMKEVRRFEAQKTSLVPARKAIGTGLGLPKEQGEKLQSDIQIQKNEKDSGAQFWHMKAYLVRFREKILSAVGSANFTEAGLSGVNGNVEAMLVFESNDWFPKRQLATLEELADKAAVEEGAPDKLPFAIIIAWDWQGLGWRWWFRSDGVEDVQLTLPGLHSFAISDAGTCDGTPPPRGSAFTLHYRHKSDRHEWKGSIVEINLDHSQRTYGQPLSPAEILESWRDSSHGASTRTRNAGEESEDDEVTPEVQRATFDVVNLFDFYRSVDALKKRLNGLRNDPTTLRAYLVGRPESVMTLALLASGDEGNAPTVRFLVLRELAALMAEWKDLLAPEILETVEQMVLKFKRRVMELLKQEVGENADPMLEWFEQRLAEKGGVH